MAQEIHTQQSVGFPSIYIGVRVLFSVSSFSVLTSLLPSPLSVAVFMCKGQLNTATPFLFFSGSAPAHVPTENVEDTGVSRDCCDNGRVHETFPHV